MLKKHYEAKDLCEGLPEELGEFLKYAEALRFDENPDYDYLH